MPGSDHGTLGVLDALSSRRSARARSLLDRAEGRVLVVDERDPATVGPDEGPFDSVVSTFALCRVDDLDATLEAVGRLLAPDGQLLFLEHVPPPGWRRHARRAVAGAWAAVAGGCHFDRDVPQAARRAGLVVTELERFTMPTAVWPLRTCAEGSARRTRRTRNLAGGAA